MSRSRIRLLWVTALVPLVVLASAGVYMVGMERLEGRSRTFLEAVSWAAETLTTTGYGADAHWGHPFMVVFVIAMQFLGVFLVFLMIPIYLIPLLEKRFDVRLPTRASNLADHVVIYRWGPAVATLLEELETAHVPALVVESDPTIARRLFDHQHPVVLTTLEEPDALDAVRLAKARALIANATDDDNMVAVLAAREAGFHGDIFALVEDPLHRRALTVAGATAVFTPRHLLAAVLAARASVRIAPRILGAPAGSQLELTELRVEPGSPLAGQTLRQADIGRRTGASIVGQWLADRIVAPLDADSRLLERSIITAVGSRAALDRLSDLIKGTTPLRTSGPFVVGGAGEVGRKVAQLLRDAGETVRLVDSVAAPGVDIVGDLKDPAVLREIGVGEAQALILAIDSDRAALFTTVVVRDLFADVPIIARVEGAAGVERIHRAGADFALAISQVSGQLLARRLLGAESHTLDVQLRVFKVDTGALVGRRAAELDLRAMTGCSIVAVERDGEVRVDLGGNFRFMSDDVVYACGGADAARRYHRVFGSSGSRQIGD